MYLIMVLEILDQNNLILMTDHAAADIQCK